jgi:hypothetical protein
MRAQRYEAIWALMGRPNNLTCVIAKLYNRGDILKAILFELFDLLREIIPRLGLVQIREPT